MQINALKDATITSSAGKVTVAAKDEILLTSGGAYIKIKDGNIELGCPKMVWVKCAGFQVMGPSSAGVNIQGIPAVEKYDEQFQLLLPDSSPMRFVEYNIRSGEQEITGKTTSKGMSQRIHTEQKQELEVELKWVGFTADLPYGEA